MFRAAALRQNRTLRRTSVRTILFFSARCRYNREYSRFNRFSRRFAMKQSGPNPTAACLDLAAIRRPEAVKSCLVRSLVVWFSKVSLSGLKSRSRPFERIRFFPSDSLQVAIQVSMQAING
jgi:hypothetical protein